MQPEIKKYLFDILNCIKNIEMFVNEDVDFYVYKKNLMLQQATERNLEIIGEAMNNILKIFPEIKITNARKIVDTRNRLIHSYDGVQTRQVWEIINNNLPLLRHEVEEFLGN